MRLGRGPKRVVCVGNAKGGCVVPFAALSPTSESMMHGTMPAWTLHGPVTLTPPSTQSPAVLSVLVLHREHGLRM